MKIQEIFQVVQGHQITDSEIYRNQGKIPVYTGRNQIKGFWNNSLIEENDLPCITYPTKANSGEAYVQDKLFDANNTAALIPFDSWRDKIDLYWFAYKLSKIFPDIQTSKEGVSYLNKEIVEDIKMEIPPKDIQIEEYSSISNLLHIKEKLSWAIERIKRIKKSDLILEYNEYQKKNVSAEEIFECISGNSGLTEQYVYQNLQSKEERKYIFLTGSVEIDESIKLPLCPKPKNKAKKINIFSGEGIHVVRKGKAGNTNYLKNENYTLNDDAYILKVKDNFKLDLSLKWFVKVYRKNFIQFASNSDNGTWNKNSFFENSKFDIPRIEEQKEMLKKFEALDYYEEKCKDVLGKINDLLDKEINYNN